jgi:hypothetical protein
MNAYEMPFETYMHTKSLMYFKVVVFNCHGEYVDEFDNYEEKNYKVELVRKYANYMVTEEQVTFKKVKGYAISTTIIHIQELGYEN